MVRFKFSFLPLTVLWGRMFWGSPPMAPEVHGGIQIVVVVFFLTCTQKSEFERNKAGPSGSGHRVFGLRVVNNYVTFG